MKPLTCTTNCSHKSPSVSNASNCHSNCSASSISITLMRVTSPSSRCSIGEKLMLLGPAGPKPIFCIARSMMKHSSMTLRSLAIADSCSVEFVMAMWTLLKGACGQKRLPCDSTAGVSYCGYCNDTVREFDNGSMPGPSIVSSDDRMVQ